MGYRERKKGGEVKKFRTVNISDLQLCPSDLATLLRVIIEKGKEIRKNNSEEIGTDYKFVASVNGAVLGIPGKDRVNRSPIVLSRNPTLVALARAADLLEGLENDEFYFPEPDEHPLANSLR